MKHLFLFSMALTAFIFTSCNNEDDPIPVIPPSDGSIMTLNGGLGGSSAQNSVFVDFSDNSQDSVKRNSWDLGFYCTGDFRVIINNTSGSVAQVIDKTDINSVSTADTVGLGSKLTFGQLANLANVDNVEGDLAKTVISEISATGSDNKVYVIRSGAKMNPSADVMKIKILRKGSSGYTLQYAKLTDTTFKTLDVEKDSKMNFVYVSFEKNGKVTVEPEKTGWDIEWTATTNKSGEDAYFFSDFVYINSYAGVEAAEVMVSEVGFVDFSPTHVTADLFNNSIRTLIGDKWRDVMPPVVIGVYTDRFYVIKDTSGNIYKLRFLKMGANNGADGGVRGYPQIEYKLVK